MRDYYRILGVREDDGLSVIKSAYRELGLKYHPDRPSGDEDKWKLIAEAYSVLGDAERRKSYDDRRNGKRKFTEDQIVNILNVGGLSTDIFGSDYFNHYKAPYEEIRDQALSPVSAIHLAFLDRENKFANFGRGNGIFKYRDIFENKVGSILTFKNGTKFTCVQSPSCEDLIMLWPSVNSIYDKQDIRPTVSTMNSFIVLGYDSLGILDRIRWTNTRTCWIAKIFKNRGTGLYELRFTSRQVSDFDTFYMIDSIKEKEIVLKNGPFRRLRFERRVGRNTIICWLPSTEQLHSRFVSRCRVAWGGGYNTVGPIPINIWRKS